MRGKSCTPANHMNKRTRVNAIPGTGRQRPSTFLVMARWASTTLHPVYASVNAGDSTDTPHMDLSASISVTSHR
ncbi:hypothetical protein V2G26_012028 [Clonostachys chloroleuca]